MARRELIYAVLVSLGFLGSSLSADTTGHSPPRAVLQRPADIKKDWRACIILFVVLGYSLATLALLLILRAAHRGEPTSDLASKELLSDQRRSSPDFGQTPPIAS